MYVCMHGWTSRWEHKAAAAHAMGCQRYKNITVYVVHLLAEWQKRYEVYTQAVDKQHQLFEHCAHLWGLKLALHIHPFNGPFSGTTRVSWYQKGKPNLDFTGARDSEWQWHQLGHVQVRISLQTDNHASTPQLKFFYRPDALPAAKPTASKHWRH